MNIINGIDFDQFCNCGHDLSCHWADWNAKLNCGDCKCLKFKRDNLKYLESKYEEKNH